MPYEDTDLMEPTNLNIWWKIVLYPITLFVTFVVFVIIKSILVIMKIQEFIQKSVMGRFNQK
jgi:hypothetical protein